MTMVSASNRVSMVFEIGPGSQIDQDIVSLKLADMVEELLFLDIFDALRSDGAEHTAQQSKVFNTTIDNQFSQRHLSLEEIGQGDLRSADP